MLSADAVMMCCRYAFSSHMYYLHILPAFIIIVYHRHIVPSNITIMFSSFNSITRSNHIFPGVPGHIGAPRWFSRKSSARAVLRRALGHQGRVPGVPGHLGHKVPWSSHNSLAPSQMYRNHAWGGLTHPTVVVVLRGGAGEARIGS
jgi:hypothetical protein